MLGRIVIIVVRIAQLALCLAAPLLLVGYLEDSGLAPVRQIAALALRLAQAMAGWAADFLQDHPNLRLELQLGSACLAAAIVLEWRGAVWRRARAALSILSTRRKEPADSPAPQPVSDPSTI
jgi:hypothetical protein